MSVYDAKWWSLKIPENASVETCRDFVTLHVPGQFEMRLIVLRGETAIAKVSDLESYARPFCDETQDREDVDSDGWRGFAFVHNDKTNKTMNYRGYVWRGLYLIIAVVSQDVFDIDACKIILRNILEEIKFKN